MVPSSRCIDLRVGLRLTRYCNCLFRSNVTSSFSDSEPAATRLPPAGSDPHSINFTCIHPAESLGRLSRHIDLEQQRILMQKRMACSAAVSVRRRGAQLDNGLLASRAMPQSSGCGTVKECYRIGVSSHSYSFNIADCVKILLACSLSGTQSQLFTAQLPPVAPNFSATPQHSTSP